MIETVDDRIAQKIEEISEGVMSRTYKRAENIAIIILEKSDENIVKMISAMLYQVILGLFEDYYNVRKGRERPVWEHELQGHIVLLKKACEILTYYNIVPKDEIENFIYEDNLSEDVDFPRVATVTATLMEKLHKWDYTAFLVFA